MTPLRMCRGRRDAESEVLPLVACRYLLHPSLARPETLADHAVLAWVVRLAPAELSQLWREHRAEALAEAARLHIAIVASDQMFFGERLAHVTESRRTSASKS